MSEEEKDIELEKIRLGFGEVFTPQEEALSATLLALDFAVEIRERIVAEFAFQTTPFEVYLYVLAEKGAVPEEEPTVAFKFGKFKFTRFATVRQAVVEALKVTWMDRWFPFAWLPQNATVLLMPDLEPSIPKLANAKTLYEEGIFRIRGEDKLINHVDRPLANGERTNPYVEATKEYLAAEILDFPQLLLANGGTRDEFATLTLGGFAQQYRRVKTSNIGDNWATFVARSGILKLAPGDLEDSRLIKCCDLRYYSVSLEDGTTMQTDDDGAKRDRRFAAVKELVLKEGRFAGEPLEF